ncbi:MAG TPA: 5-oxoprolinase subunit PxpB [Bryobacteraceae bacterium]|nr:5-oxoprolinase subunit PxpB [Bryobacteraceae bacterium]HUI77902.1 5-oxoprolinase subunit PxpB [Bryobacteraceae bacterium]
MEIRPASDRSLLVSFGSEISLEAHRRVLRFVRAFDKLPPGILNWHPAYTSVLIDFDPRRWRYGDVESLVRERVGLAGEHVPSDTRTVEIPVCYGGRFGPDLEDVARHTGLPAARVVELHSSAEYLVYFLGFSPGFPYLGGLPAELATPRLPAPRKLVPAGSVAIGGSQTGVYTVDSPGGWRIIGRTTMPLFDAAANPPALLRIGDAVRFVPTSETPS